MPLLSEEDIILTAMLAGYLREIGEPDIRTSQSEASDRFGMDQSYLESMRYTALSGTSSLTSPGFMMNRALPGAVVAAIAFAVPGLSIENLGTKVGASESTADAAGMSVQTIIRLAPAAAPIKQGESDAPPSDMLPAFVSPTSLQTYYHALDRWPEIGASEESALVAGPSSIRAAARSGRETIATAPDPYEPSQISLLESDLNGTMAFGNAEAVQTLALPEDATVAPIELLTADDVRPVMAAPSFATSGEIRLGDQMAGIALPSQGGDALATQDVIDLANDTSKSLGEPVGRIGRLAEPAAPILQTPRPSEARAAPGDELAITRAQTTEQPPPKVAAPPPALSPRPGRSSHRLAALDVVQEPAEQSATTLEPDKSAFVPRLKGRTFAAGQGTSLPSAVAIASQLTTRVDGRVAGEIDFQQDMRSITVRIGSIVELLGDRYEVEQLRRLTQSSAGDTYLSLAQLQQAGIPISYDPVYDEFNIGSKDYLPTSAHKVQMDQISRPQREVGPIVMEQLKR